MPGKRAARPTRTSVPAKMQKTSVTSTPGDANPPVTKASSAPAAEPTAKPTAKASTTVKVSTVNEDAETPERIPKSGQRPLDDAPVKDNKPHKEETSDDDEDCNWMNAITKVRTQPSTGTHDPKPENYFKDLKKCTVSSRNFRTPVAFTLREDVILDGTGGQWGSYKLTFKISKRDGDGPWKAGCALGKAQYRILKTLAKRRGIKDKETRDAFGRACRSRAVDFDSVGDDQGFITVTTRYRNVARKDMTVYVRANPTSDEWVLPQFKITKLRAGDKIFLTGMIRGYEQQGRHGTSFYLGSKIFLEQRDLE